MQLVLQSSLFSLSLSLVIINTPRTLFGSLLLDCKTA